MADTATKARGVDVLDHLPRRRAEGVGDERHLGVLQRDLDLGRGGGLGPAEQLQGVVVGAVVKRAVDVGIPFLRPA